METEGLTTLKRVLLAISILDPADIYFLDGLEEIQAEIVNSKLLMQHEIDEWRKLFDENRYDEGL